MIASPGDVARERVIARDVLLEWNAINSSDRNVVLLPVGWDTHSAPSMYDSAQAVINSQVLERCDLLIGVFWTRLGTPTGEFASGTIEEIERHIACGKPTMIYFSNAPVVPDSIDQEQYSALSNFRESLKSRGLVSFFDDQSTFRNDLFRHVSQTVIRDFGIEGGDTELPTRLATTSPSISNDAMELLVAAVSDPSGRIANLRFIGGGEISTNGRNFIADRNARTIAKWEGALEELESLGFISARGTKREMFSVTEKGYTFTEQRGVIPSS